MTESKDESWAMYVKLQKVLTDSLSKTPAERKAILAPLVDALPGEWVDADASWIKDVAAEMGSLYDASATATDMPFVSASIVEVGKTRQETIRTLVAALQQKALSDLEFRGRRGPVLRYSCLRVSFCGNRVWTSFRFLT